MDVKINSEYITLGQLIKFVGIISNGAEAKGYLLSNKVLINGELDNRRGRKIYPGDVVAIKNTQYKVTK